MVVELLNIRVYVILLHCVTVNMYGIFFGSLLGLTPINLLSILYVYMAVYIPIHLFRNTSCHSLIGCPAARLEMMVLVIAIYMLL